MAHLTGARAAYVAILEDALDPDAFIVRTGTIGQMQLTTRDAVLVSTRGVQPAEPPYPAPHVTVELLVLGRLTAVGEASEDHLEAATDVVLAALDEAGIDWKNAQRVTWEESFPGYLIEVEYLT